MSDDEQGVTHGTVLSGDADVVLGGQFTRLATIAGYRECSYPESVTGSRAMASSRAGFRGWLATVSKVLWHPGRRRGGRPPPVDDR